MSNRNQKLRQIDEALWEMKGIISGCSPRELRGLTKKIDGLSRTNCGWYLHWAKPLLLRTAIDERQFRKPKPRKEAKQ